mmetsp:Transcript_22007/g.46287  ORF Transcript_22007/g.46287 Transcript_22007/m.46287 type:complete len:434 (-) Transcript_22007:705-2006(-)
MKIIPNVAAATHIQTAACKVWARSSVPCLFGTSLYDTIVSNEIVHAPTTATPSSSSSSSTGHCDRILVNLEEANNSRVFLSLSDGDTTTTTNTKQYRGIPLGRAKDCPTLTPRARNDARCNRRRRPYVRLAVVGMVVDRMDRHGSSSRNGDDEYDDDERVLLITRRPSYMRSFPGAFVFPGGNTDEGESLVRAVSREILEETGLNIDRDSWNLECLWESVYPTQIPAPGVDDDEEEGVIRAHHLVCYFSAQLQQEQEHTRVGEDNRQQQQTLRLCREEVDGAAWLSRGDIQSLLEASTKMVRESTDDNDTVNKNANNNEYIVPEELKRKELLMHTTGAFSTNSRSTQMNTSKDDNDNDNIDLTSTNTSTSSNDKHSKMDQHQITTAAMISIPLSDLAGIYPRHDEIEDRFCGMAQGSLFALEEFVKKNNSKNC